MKKIQVPKTIKSKLSEFSSKVWNREWSVEDFSETMKGLGFEKISENRSFHLSTNNLQEILSTKKDENKALYMIWAHPSGILVNSSSYKSGGYADSNGVWVPIKESTSNLTWRACVDSGFDLAAVQRARHSKVGTFNVHQRESGSWSLMFEDHSPQGGHIDSLVLFMEKVSRFGRLMPFEQWPTEMHVHIGDEYYSTLSADPKWKDLDSTDFKAAANEQHEKDKKAWLEKSNQSHPEFIKMLNENFFMSDDRNSNIRIEKENKLRRAGDEVEEFRHFYYYSGVRRLRPETEKILTEWVGWALHTPSDPFPESASKQKSIKGLSFSRVLLDIAPQRLSEWLYSLPLSDLEDLVLKPDNLGWTFPLRAFDLVLRPNIYALDKKENTYLREDLLKDVFEVLESRLDAKTIQQGWICPSASLIGLFAEILINPETQRYHNPGYLEKCHTILNFVTNKSVQEKWHQPKEISWSKHQWNSSPKKSQMVHQVFDFEQWNDCFSKQTPSNLPFLNTSFAQQINDLILFHALSSADPSSKSKKRLALRL